MRADEKIKLLEEGDCTGEQLIGVPVDAFRDYQTCCEQRDLLERAYASKDPTGDGIITNSIWGDIAISFSIGLLSGILITHQNQR